MEREEGGSSGKTMRSPPSKSAENRKREGNGAELRACAECAAVCASLHGNKRDLYPIVSRFSTILRGKDWKKFLLVPPTFAATVTELVGRETELENANGERWTVTLSSFHQGHAFQMGWEDFAADHKLTKRDMLVFNYIKGSHFVVQVYGRDGCEKSCITSSRRSQCKHQPVVPEENEDAMKRMCSSTSVAPEAEAEPSTTYRTQDSGGDERNPPTANEATILKNRGQKSTGDLKKREEKDQREISKQAHAKRKRDRMVIKEREERSDPTQGHGKRKRGYDQNSANASEGAFLKNSCHKSTGGVKKTVKKEPREGSEPVHGHAKSRRDLESRPHGVTDCKRVKLEPLDVPSSDGTVTCLAPTDGQRLVLPSRLPSVSFTGSKVNCKAIVLKSSKGRMWPALYDERSGSPVLLCDWTRLSRRYHSRPGDMYAFKFEARSQFIYSITYLRREE